MIEIRKNEPITVLQSGVILIVESNAIYVEWRDGEKEWLATNNFEETPDLGQEFEIITTRNPINFQIINTEKFHILPMDDKAKERAKALWERINANIHLVVEEEAEVNESFWIKTD